MVRSADEIRRVRAHIEGALSTLSNANARVIETLRRYIDAEEYPKNQSDRAVMTPIFVDEDGRRCAVAALLESTGHAALVERIARDNNFAYVEELAGDPELARWLSDNGLTVAEAARIQPSYANVVADTWQPTVSIIASAQVGGNTNAGGEVSLLPGVRVGARQVTASRGDCDRCVYRSTAWVAEYSRTIIVGSSGTNQLGLLWQHDLNEQATDHQFYAIAGPLASIDESGKPGFGLGGELGAGFSLRQRSFPFLVEVVLATIAGGEGVTVRGGTVIGVTW